MVVSFSRIVDSSFRFFHQHFHVLLISLVAFLGTLDASAATCNATNTGMTNSGTLVVSGTPCTGGIDLSVTGAVCVVGGCTIEYMFIIYQPGGYQFSTAWSTTPSATVTAPSAGSWNVLGCVRAQGKSIPCETSITTISVVAGPSGTPTNLNATPACAGASFTLSGSVGGGNTIKWYNSTNNFIGTGTSIGHSEASAGTYTYKAYLNNGTCNASTYASINVTVYANPSGSTVSGNGTGILGTAYTFSVGSISGATYDWTYTPVGTGSSSTNSIDITWSTTGSKSVCVTVETGSGACSAYDCADITINSNCPVASFGNPGTNCTGETVVFTADDQGAGVSYSWDFGSNATPASANGIGPHNVSYGTSGSKTATLTVNKSGCSANQKSEIFTINQTPIANITGPITGFGQIGIAYTFSTPSVGGASYSWNYSAAGSGSSSTNTIDITWTTTGTKNVSVEVSLNGCTKIDDLDFVVNTDCYPSSTHYEQFPLAEDMDGKTIVDGAGTAITFNVTDPNGDVTSFNLDQTFSQSGDTTILYTQDAGSNTTARIRANVPISDLTFCIRDLDYRESGANYAYEAITVNAFQSGTQITIDNSIYSIGSSVLFGNSNTFYGISAVTNGSSNGDVCLDFDGYDVDSLHLIFFTQQMYGSISQDIGISNLDWCTPTQVPVTWLNIAAVQKENGVLLNWSTASEINNDYFSIESSSNGRDFYAIGTLAGSGTSNQINTYSYQDNSPFSQVRYYRIKQTDFDGQFDYSNIVMVSNSTTKGDFIITPNPVVSDMTVQLNKYLAPGNYEIRIVDLTGKVLYKSTILQNNGQAGIKTFDMDDLPTGIYYLNVSGNNYSHVQRVVLMH